MTAVALLLSVVTRNWVLAILCAVSTAGLRKLNDKVELPKVYTQRGIKNGVVYTRETTEMKKIIK